MQSDKKQTDAINKEAGEEILSWDEEDSHHWKMVRKHDGAALNGTFVSPLFVVTFKCPEAKIDNELEISVHSGEVQFLFTNPHKAMFVNTPEDIARGLVRDFLTR